MEAYPSSVRARGRAHADFCERWSSRGDELAEARRVSARQAGPRLGLRRVVLMAYPRVMVVFVQLSWNKLQEKCAELAGDEIQFQVESGFG